MSNYRVQKQRTWKTELPVFDHKDNLINSVKQHATTVVVGETGAGKSTQLPQYLADALLPEPKMNGKRQGCIVCTQPRRVAAVTIAQQVSAEWGGKVGEQVGYSIRFEDRTSADTRIKFVTDGVLLRECMSDRDLRQYKVVILDEAHERSLQTDILMGLLRQIQERRSDLKIVVMSATLQIQVFQNFFKDVHLVSIPGRQFPVKAMYTKEPESDYVDAAMLTCLQIHEEMEDTGGVLVFLPGQDDIESLQALLEENLPNIETKGNDHLHYSTQKFDRNYITNDSEPNPSLTVTVQHNFMIRPLYAALPPDDQVKVFAPAPKGVRKFVLATNIAETSVTITGIKYVIDTGFAKTRFINESTGVEMLKVLPISKFQANQRLGRAGRESAGICYRLYTEPTFMTLREASIPEIQRTNIAQVLLQLKVLGVTSPAAFPFVSPPTKISLRKALELLYLLGAIDDNQQLTEHGRRMAMLPLDPLFSNMLLVSVSLNCVHEALTAVSLLSSESVFVQPYREDQKKEAASAHRRLSSR